MGNRVLQAKRVKINAYKMRRKGKMNEKQILKDRVSEFKPIRYPKTGGSASVKGLSTFGSQPGSLFRTRKGEIFVAKDSVDEYFAHKFARRFTDEEMKMGQPGEDGWITSNATPLAAVKEKLRRLAGEDDIQKWLHFAIRREAHTHIDLFFSPKKDKWFYININPVTGEAQRSNILGSKNVAEQKRLNKKLTWIPLNDRVIPI